MSISKPAFDKDQTIPDYDKRAFHAVMESDDVVLCRCRINGTLGVAIALRHAIGDTHVAMRPLFVGITADMEISLDPLGPNIRVPVDNI